MGFRACEFDLSYHPRPAIKAQVLANFLVERTIPDDPEPISEQAADATRQPWILHVDGSSMVGGNGAGLILFGPDGIIAEQAIRFAFPASNNEAKYEVLIAGLKLARELGVQHLRAYSDS